MTGTPVQPSSASCCSTECVFCCPQSNKGDGAEMIMKLSVLIRFETDTVTCACRSRQERRGRAAVKVVNNVVIFGAKLTRRPRCATSVRHVPEQAHCRRADDDRASGATQSSTSMSTWIFGRKRFNAKAEGVAKTVSPIDRSRTSSTLRTSAQSQRGGASGCAAS